MQEILKQPQYEPMEVEDQVIVVYAGTHGYADNVELDRMEHWESSLLRFMEANHPEIMQNILKETRLTDEIEESLNQALSEFMSTWQ